MGEVKLFFLHDRNFYFAKNYATNIGFTLIPYVISINKGFNRGFRSVKKSWKEGASSPMKYTAPYSLKRNRNIGGSTSVIERVTLCSLHLCTLPHWQHLKKSNSGLPHRAGQVSTPLPFACAVILTSALIKLRILR